MKVHLFSYAALVAVALAPQGIAQQNENSLERALADLNSGLVAPAQNGGGPTWAGGFRARNAWHDDGTETNNIDIDVRTFLEMHWNVTDATRVFVGMNASESFGDPVSTFSPFPGTPGSLPTGADIGSGAFDVVRAYAEADSLLGLGGTSKIGRDRYQVGTGRIVGTDHWDNVPVTHAGIWYDNHLTDNIALHTSITNDMDSGNVEENDGRLWVVTLPTSFEYENGGEVEVTPYYLRWDMLGGPGSTWFGFAAEGEILGFEWGFEFADNDNGGVSGSAFALDVEYELDALESMPFVESGEVFFQFSSADEEFFVITPSYHGAIGFSDHIGRGGQWSNGTDAFGLGFGVTPAEGWDGELAFYSVEQEIMGFTDEWTEINLSVGTELTGNIDAWFGIANVDPDMGDSDLWFWATLDLNFGGEDDN